MQLYVLRAVSFVLLLFVMSWCVCIGNNFKQLSMALTHMPLRSLWCAPCVFVKNKYVTTPSSSLFPGWHLALCLYIATSVYSFIANYILQKENSHVLQLINPFFMLLLPSDYIPHFSLVITLRTYSHHWPNSCSYVGFMIISQSVMGMVMPLKKNTPTRLSNSIIRTSHLSIGVSCVHPNR